MIRYLLDTCVISDVAKGVPQVQSRIKALPPNEMAISVISRFELLFGVLKNPRMSPKTRDSVFEMLQKLVCFHFEPQDADIGAQIRATLAQTGRPIGPYDLLLAATALRHGLTLVTSNEKEFSRIPDLKWENWRLMV